MAYNYVIVDSSLFKKPLSDKALAFLNGKTVLLLPSFYHEVEAYSRILDGNRADVLRKNIAQLLKKAAHGTTTISTSKLFDLFSAAVSSAKQGISLCVMTSDILLIERFCMENAQLDIYDLNTDLLKKVKPLSKVCFVDHRQMSSNEVPNVFNMRNTTLTDENGKSVTLFGRLSEGNNQEDFGLESAIYNICGHPELVAKIYRYYPSDQKQTHLKKLQALSKEMNLPWCLLPLQLLYKDNKLIGFTMRKKKVKMLSDDTLYLGNEQIIEPTRLMVKKSQTLDFAITMMAQVKILNCYGISICDYNPNNFSMYYPDMPIVMFDTDSFVLGNYYANVIDDKAFTRHYQSSDKLQLAQQADEQALKFTFRLLSLGANPLIRTGYPYIFSNPQSPLLYRRDYFPHNVESYYKKVFTKQTVPSINLTLHKLTEAKRELDKHPERDITAKRMIESACNTQAQSRTNNRPVKKVTVNNYTDRPADQPTVSFHYTPAPNVSKSNQSKSKVGKWLLRAAVIVSLCIGICCWLTNSGVI